MRKVGGVGVGLGFLEEKDNCKCQTQFGKQIANWAFQIFLSVSCYYHLQILNITTWETRY